MMLFIASYPFVFTEYNVDDLYMQSVSIFYRATLIPKTVVFFFFFFFFFCFFFVFFF